MLGSRSVRGHYTTVMTTCYSLSRYGVFQNVAGCYLGFPPAHTAQYLYLRPTRLKGLRFRLKVSTFILSSFKKIFLYQPIFRFLDFVFVLIHCCNYSHAPGNGTGEDLIYIPVFLYSCKYHGPWNISYPDKAYN